MDSTAKAQIKSEFYRGVSLTLILPRFISIMEWGLVKKSISNIK